MTPEATRGGAPRATGWGSCGLPALLCSAALACIVPGPATARDPGQPDRDLPCNDLCRAWMSWRPDRRPAADRQLEPATEEMGGAARPAHAAIPPRPTASMRARQADVEERPARPAAWHPVRSAKAAAFRNKPSPPRTLPPLRPSALVSTPAEPVDAAAGAESPHPGRPAAATDSARDRTGDRIQSEADAAVLARPLYELPRVGEAPMDRSKTPESASVGGTEALAVDPATPRVEIRPDDRDVTGSPLVPTASGPAPHATPAAATLPSPPATVRMGAPSAPPRPAADSPTAAERGRPAPVHAVPVPALPASDLERLVETKPREGPVVSALPTAPAPPTVGVLLLSALAVLSLVGLRRRTLGDTT